MNAISSKRVVRTAIGAVLVCVVGLYAFLRLSHQGANDGNLGNSSSPASRVVPLPARDERLPDVAADSKHALNSPEKPPEKCAPAEESCSVSIRFVNDGGTPIGYIKFGFWLSGRVQRAGFERADQNGSADLYAAEGSICELEVTNWKEAAEKSGKAVRSVTDDYQYYSERVTFSFQKIPGHVTVRVGDAASVRLRIAYDDGEPFEDGACLISGRWSRWFAVSGRQPMELHGVVCDRTSRLTVFPRRPGYERVDFEIAMADMQSGRVLDYVIPAAKNARGAIIVDCPGSEYDSFALYMRQQAGVLVHSPELRGERTGAGLLKSEPVDPGRYELIVLWRRQVGPLGSGQIEYWVWSAPIVEVAGGKTLTLTPDFSVAGSLEVEVLSDDGKPLQRALVQLGGQLPVSLDSPRATVGMTGVTDDHGIARIDGLPRGSTDLSIEARGFEPVRMTADIPSGGVAKLPAIRLIRARGAITILLISRVMAWKYNVSLKAGDSVGYFLSSIPVEGSQVEIDGLPVERTYTVFIYPSPGGSVKQIDVTLTATEPSREVAVDVSDLERN